MAARKGIGVGLATAFAVVGVSRPLRADWDVQLGATMAGGWLRETPAFDTEKISTSSRDVGENSIKSRGARALVGFQLDVDIVLDDRWKIPTLGGNFFWAVGSYPTTVTSLDGSIARTRDWTTRRADFLLPGIGRRWKHRRYMFEAALRTGVSFISVDGSVAAGSEVHELENTLTMTFLVQAELEGCRRLDPTTRVCLQVIPRLYEHSWLNGGMVGLRFEWGR
ncbi:MAG: hypothetical protein KIT84_34820 [Labilithrix sp.]|nr:hypothetical protein [Labilithrix sp.]MCW5816223.1 hypothetical protein [Labilithrix sp.]